MTELDTKYRRLVCELLGIDPTRPMPQVGFGLAFFTPEELRQLQVKVWRHSAALTMDQWQQVPIRERIALLEEVLRNAASVKKESKPAAVFIASQQLEVEGQPVHIHTEPQSNVIEALVKLRKCSGQQLKDASGQGDVHSLLKRAIHDNPVLAKYITMPGRDKGGYRTTIVFATPSDNA